MLDRADEMELHLTKMQLLKLLYFAHGWWLALRDSYLVDGEFEAWDRGPVLRPVYDAFASVPKSKPIAIRARRFDPFTGQFGAVPEIEDSGVREFLRRVLQIYGHLSASMLSKMTHVTGSPWDQVWNAPRGEVHLGMVIPNDLIRGYFLNLMNREKIRALWYIPGTERVAI